MSNSKNAFAHSKLLIWRMDANKEGFMNPFFCVEVSSDNLLFLVSTPFLYTGLRRKIESVHEIAQRTESRQ